MTHFVLVRQASGAHAAALSEARCPTARALGGCDQVRNVCRRCLVEREPLVLSALGSVSPRHRRDASLASSQVLHVLRGTAHIAEILAVKLTYRNAC